MKLSPKIAKKPEDLVALPYKKLKQLLKKELTRFEKETSAEQPTNFILLGKHSFPDKPATAGLPFFVLGNWKPPFRNHVKNTLLKQVELKKMLVGKAFFGGEEGEQKVIQLLTWKGKGTASFFDPQFKKMLPKGYIVKYGLLEEDQHSQEEAPTTSNKEETYPSMDPFDTLKFGDTPLILTPQVGKNSSGQEFAIPANTEVQVIQTGERSGSTKFMAVVEGELVYFELENDNLSPHFALDLAPVEVVASTEFAINRLVDLKEEDWSNWFHDIGDDKISYILQSFNEEEQETFLLHSGLRKFATYELGTKALVSGIAAWELPLLDKLRFLSKENKIKYEDCRELFVQADLTGFDIKEHFNLLPFKKNPKSLAQFCQDVNLGEKDKQWLEDKLNLLAGRSMLEVTLEEPLYDDLKDKDRALKIDAVQLALLNKINGLGFGRASTTEQSQVIEWFQKNALTETFALLDVSEQQVQAILNKYAGGQWNGLEEDFLAVMNAPYAEGIYTHRQALLQRGNDRTSHIIAQREVRKAVEQALGKKHPIVYTIQDFTKLTTIIEKGKQDKLQNFLEDALIEKLANIEATRENLRNDPELVWNLEVVINNTYQNLALNPATPSGQIVVEHQKAYQRNKTFVSLALAALSVGLGILGAFATGGFSLLITGSALAVGAYDFSRELNEYQIQEAAANTSLLRAEALTKQQPEFLWVALAGIGILGDAAAVTKVLKNLKIGSLKSLDQVDQYSEEVAKALAKEKGLSIEASSAEFQQLKQLVKDQALEHLARAERAQDAQKQLDYEQFRIALKELAVAGAVAPMGGPVMAIAKLPKVLMYTVKNGARTVEDALKFADKQINGLLKKNGVDITDPKQQQQLQEVFNQVLQEFFAKEKRVQDAFDAVDNLRGIPPEKIYEQQAVIQKVWDDFLEETPAPVVELSFGSKASKHKKAIKISFDSNGNIMPLDADGNVVTLNRRQKLAIYEKLELDHAAENHSIHKENRELAVRTLTNTNAQSSKYKTDQILIMGAELAKKKCFDANGVFDGEDLVKKGILTKSDNKYEFVLPIPSDYGTVYINTKHSRIASMPEGKIPDWVKQENQPFPNDEGLKDVIEVPMTELLIVFDRTGKIITSYGRAFPSK